MSGASFLFLSQEDVVAAGGMEVGPTIEVVAEALRLHARGETILPHKPTIRWSDDLDSEERDGRIMAMPAYVGGSFDVAGLKWIPSVPTNPTRGLPRGIGLILLTSRETGVPQSARGAPGQHDEAGREHAAFRVRPTNEGLEFADAPVPERADGLIEDAQLLALEHELSGLREVRVFDVSADRAEAFCRRAAERRPSVRFTVAASAREACAGADVIVPVTVAREPYIEPSWLAPGSLFVSISSLDPTIDVIRQADLLVCDDWEHETGHAARPFARAVAESAVAREQVIELGELLIGAKPGRRSEDQRVFVSPVGLAVEDVAAAHRVWTHAVEQGIGTSLELWRTPTWI